MAVKINSLELESVKKIKAVQFEPTKNGLTIIGGDNRQGKTSVLDAISWAVGGNKYKPSNPKNDDLVTDPYLKVELSNGLIVERKGKNSDLKVTDPNGEKSGQSLLDSFISTFALDLPKFMNQTNTEKGKTLLKIIGLESELNELELKEGKLYSDRYEIGRIKDKKEKYASELIEHEDVPTEKISVADLIKEQQEILAKNGENQRLRNKLKDLVREQEVDQSIYSILEGKIKELQNKKAEVLNRLENRADQIQNARKTTEQLIDESDEEIIASINNIESINKKIEENANKKRALDEYQEYKAEYDDLTEQIKNVREEKIKLLTTAKLPLNGLSIEDGELTYLNQKWDGMSASEQLIVATSIVKALNPDCGFVLMDKLEQLDLTTLKEFGEWLEDQDLQVIATRVSKGDECQIIIEDGKIVSNDNEEVKAWKKGEF
ncbi:MULTISPECIES: AAA family ATPase [Helcococcus]|uniref:AAA family ATPase n=1 Tax=Helcococcus bovis TaxID=3153252 RepID=A0ABW9F721_9FIRM